MVSLSTLKKLESIAEPRRIVVPRTKILLETQVTNSSLNIEERTPFKGRLSAEETIMPTQLTEVVCLQNRTPGSRRGVVDQSPEKTLRLKSSGWTIPKQPTHFLYHPEVTMLSSPYTTNDFSPCKMVINPSAHRPSLRRTRETNFRVKSHHTSSLWVIRGISAGLLVSRPKSHIFLRSEGGCHYCSYYSSAQDVITRRAKYYKSKSSETPEIWSPWTSKTPEIWSAWTSKTAEIWSAWTPKFSFS